MDLKGAAYVQLHHLVQKNKDTRQMREIRYSKSTPCLLSIPIKTYQRLERRLAPWLLSSVRFVRFGPVDGC